MELSHQAARIPLKFVFFEPSKINPDLVNRLLNYSLSCNIPSSQVDIKTDVFLISNKSNTKKQFQLWFDLDYELNLVCSGIQGYHDIQPIEI